MSAVHTHALPIESRKKDVEQRLALLDSAEADTSGSNGAVLTSVVSSLRVRDLDRHLYSVRDDVSCKQITDWRRRYVQQNGQSTVEQAIAALRSAVLPQMRKRRLEAASAVGQNADEAKLSLLDTIEQRNKRRRQTSDFEERLRSIAPLVDCQDDADGTLLSAAARECQICFEQYRDEDTLHCLSNEAHVICCKCMYEYARNNATKHSPDTLPCPQCLQPFDRIVLRVNLPAQLFAEMERRQASVDWRVALASNVEATLYCECGLVAIVERDAIGDQTVTCAQCPRRYCLKCGNFAHPGSTCPAPRETICWLDAHRGKCCPNCGEGIEKDGGCAHMTCRSCRHEFCWRCLGKWPRCNCPRN